MFGYASYRFAEFLSRALPRRAAYWVGLRIGDLVYRSDARKREAVCSNVRQILLSQNIEPADEHIPGIARKTFQYFGKYMVDFFRTARFSPDEIRRLVSFEHREHLDRALAHKRGVIIVSAHFGNWELAGAVLESLGYDLNVVVLPERLRRLERLLEEHRKKRGFNILPLGEAARGILHCLKRGEIVAMLADRDFTRHHVTVDFFGKPARMPAGPARLSLRTGAPIVPGLLLREEDDTFLLRLAPPIFPEQEGSADQIQKRICKFLERNIGERPHQWFVFEPHWISS